MNDRELDNLFAQARAQTPEDAGVAQRFLTWHRQEVRRTRQARAGWMSALVACAAVLSGALVLRPVADAPASVAYQAYEGSLGAGW